MMSTTDAMQDRRLHAIAGQWATSGHVVGDPPTPVRGVDVYEVLPGGHFLVHHVDVTVGDRPVKAIEILGEHDPDNADAYLARSFDSDGNAEVMRLTVAEDGALRFVGGPEIAPAAQRVGAAPVSVRSTLVGSNDGQSMTARWERSPDGITWEPWMDIGFRRIR